MLYQIGLFKGAGLHTLRHDYCTNLLEQGVSIYKVKDVMGHKDIRTTQIYQHSLDKINFEQFEEAGLGKPRNR